MLQGRPNADGKHILKYFLKKIGFEGVDWIKPDHVRTH
jgi:hypothetical protein